MKKKYIFIAVAAITFTAVLAVLYHYGYIEYIIDSGKIDRSKSSHSTVVTLQIGYPVLIKKPYDNIIQIKSDKTITENTFRVIKLRLLSTRTMYPPPRRSYNDLIIKGKTRILSDSDYDSVIDMLRKSDFESIQTEIDNPDALWLDGNSTYISFMDDNEFHVIGGHCADGKSERFLDIMNSIIGISE